MIFSASSGNHHRHHAQDEKCPGTICASVEEKKTSGVSCTDPGASSPRSPFVAALELRGCDNCDVM